MEKIKALFEKYREGILYLFFGGCTTLVNYFSYLLCTRAMGMSVAWATAVAWLLSVLFAYATNRKWVFESKATGARDVLSEMAKFFAGRIATGVMDIIIMKISVDMLGANDLVMKLLSNVLVIILNYFISKIFVFKK